LPGVYNFFEDIGVNGENARNSSCVYVYYV